MFLSKFKKFSLLPLSFALGFLIFMGIAVVYAWTEPSQTPPNGNVAAPLNIGASSQYKSGALGVGGAFHGYDIGIFDGNVGIGTTGPGAQLHLADIYGAGGKNLLIGDDTYLSDIDQANILGIYGEQNSDRAGIRLGSDGSYIFGDNGNMGIGTTGPSQKLDVAGYVKGQSGLCIGDNCRTSWPGGDFFSRAVSASGYQQPDGSWNNMPSGNPQFSFTAPVAGAVLVMGQIRASRWDCSGGSGNYIVKSRIAVNGSSLGEVEHYDGTYWKRALVNAGPVTIAAQAYHWDAPCAYANSFKGIYLFIPSQQ